MRSILVLSCVLILSACGAYAPSRMAGVASGFVAHQLCSAVFIAGLDESTYYKEAIAPVVKPGNWLTSRHVRPDTREVTASFFGLARVRARNLGDAGCLVLHGDEPGVAIAIPRTHSPPLLPVIAGAAPVAPATRAVRAALDRAFAEPERGPPRQTKAVVIVHRGRVIAERYAPGYGIDTPLQGWSMTKSVTNALLGILVREGKLDMYAPAPIAAWSDSRDPRHRITPDQLLRMVSGLDIGQSLVGGVRTIADRASQMMFVERDPSAFVERAPLKHAPGTHWNYSNGNTKLLARIVRDAAGGDGAAVLSFARRELFDKLGMQRVTLELDAQGVPMSASHMWATARDWARFGLLYLNDGKIADQRILPAGWVEYSAMLTPGSEEFGYGAGFWTNRGASVGGRARVAGGMPSDALIARGSFGQFIAIVPSRQLVIARFGYSFNDRGDQHGMMRLVADTLAALASAP